MYTHVYRCMCIRLRVYVLKQFYNKIPYVSIYVIMQIFTTLFIVENTENNLNIQNKKVTEMKFQRTYRDDIDYSHSLKRH